MINCSIVIYNPDLKKIDDTICCVLSCKLLNKLYIIDNSEKNTFSKYIFKYGEKIEYIFNNKNYGFGKGHNIALNISISKNIDFHVLINPDVYFDNNTIEQMFYYMIDKRDIAMMMPKLVNPDNTTQFLPKLIPNPFSIILRIISKKTKFLQKFTNKYELKFVDEDLIYETPIISGCFVLLNIQLLQNETFFDEKYFMYFEDWDLSRRVSTRFKTIYYPKVKVVHEYASGANKNLKLLFIYIYSAIHYFNKWGWFFDTYRSRKNNITMLQFK